MVYAISEIRQNAWTYTVTFRSDGTAEYEGECCRPMLGKYRAHIDSATFISLAAYLLRRNFVDLQGDYRLGGGLEETDTHTTTTTVVLSGDQVVISREDEFGPPVLNQIEGAVEVVVDWLKWTKVR